MSQEAEARRVLVVDDSVSIVFSIGKILELNGYVEETAYNGSDALRKISQQVFDVVLCDIEMPGISGMSFLERVRDEYDQELDVILMTGFLDQDYFIQAIRLGASDFIRKPIESKQLLHSIGRILERRRNKNGMTNFYQSLHGSSMSFEIDPSRFWQAGISKVFNYFLRHSLKLKRNYANELLVCLDEMVYNALIHGTLNLNTEQRRLGHDELRELITKQMDVGVFSQKSIHVTLDLDFKESLISISVEDDGDGFDHQNWLQRLQKEQEINFDAHGRGISMLYHLSDHLQFDNGGRKVTIKRALPTD